MSVSVTSVLATPDQQAAQVESVAAHRRRARSGRRPGRRFVVVGSAVALTAVSGAVFLHEHRQRPTPLAAEKLVAWADPAAGFAIGRPAGWGVTEVPDGVMFTTAGRDAVSVRRTVLAHPPAQGSDLRAVTDAVLGAPGAHLDVLSTASTTVAGLSGVCYLYTFGSADGRGAHNHCFLFGGRNMYSLVFQALPDTGFAALAPVFDAMVSSFRATSA